MEDKSSWVPYQQLDWEDPKNNRFNIDTRDWHSGYLMNGTIHKDYDTLKKSKDSFFHTKEELVTLLDRLYNESGGEGEWRCLELKHVDARVRNWRLKYIRIHRTDIGFIVCNADEVAIPKRILESEVYKDLLNFM